MINAINMYVCVCGTAKSHVGKSRVVVMIAMGVSSQCVEQATCLQVSISTEQFADTTGHRQTMQLCDAG